MAVVPHPVGKAGFMKIATLTAAVVGATDTDTLTPQVSEIRFTPAVQSGSWTGVSGNVISDQGVATWTLTLGMVQDWDTTGMIWWLLANEGKKCVFTALLTTGVTVTITATISPAEIGGPVSNTPLVATVALLCDGKPVKS